VSKYTKYYVAIVKLLNIMPVLSLLRSKAYIYRIVKLLALATLLLFLFTGFFGCGANPVVVGYSAYLDGKPWQGLLSFTVENTGGLNTGSCYAEQPRTDTFYTVNQMDRVSRFGEKTTYISGRPPGAVFEGIFYFEQYILKTGHADTQQFIQGKTDSRSYAMDSKSKKTTGCGGAPGYNISYGFVFRSPRTVNVNATLDGKPWSGPVSYSITSVIDDNLDLNHINIEIPDPVHHYSITKTREGSVSPQTYNDITGNNTTLKYVSGGPKNADLISITPDVLELQANQTGDITMNFKSKNVEDTQNKENNNNNNTIVIPAAPNQLNVTATLDGSPWQGALNYTISGTQALSGASVAKNFPSLEDGAYYAAYVSGGPPNAELKKTSVLGTSIVGGKTGILTFDFVSKGSLTVNGFIGNSPWSGNCRYSIDGPVHLTGSNVPLTFKDVPLGQYTLTYMSGGPEGYGFDGLMPQTLKLTADAANGNYKIYFNLPPPGIAATGADLQVGLNVNNLHPASATNITYTITVTNNGPLATTGVTASFPKGVLNYIGDTGAGAYVTGTGVWTIGNMASGASVTLTVTLNTGAYTAGSIFTHTATITASSATDPAASNNSASVTIVLS
jgi:hypothetical protein